FPPSCRIRSPAWAATDWLVATTPLRATTSERACGAQPPARSPRTAVMATAGSGVAAVGVPNGVALTVPGGATAASAAVAGPAVVRATAAATPPLSTVRRVAAGPECVENSSGEFADTPISSLGVRGTHRSKRGCQAGSSLPTKPRNALVLAG